MANVYYSLTGESPYMGETVNGVHMFVDGNVHGDDAAREHMRHLLDNARRLIREGHRWELRGDRNALVAPDDTVVRTVAATDHPWREGE
jgi:hypothetical protein